jgi:thioredoxin 1
MEMSRIIGSNEFEDEIKEGIVIVDFFAEWCSPCKMLAPIFEELGNEMVGQVKFIKVNVDESSDIANKYNITNIPAMLILKNREEQDITVGFSPKEAIRSRVEKYL